MRYLLIIGIAFILDLLFGDPYWLPHPICLIGKMVAFMEEKLRKLISNELLAGTLLVAVILTVTYGIPFAVLFLANEVHPYLAIGIETFFCYQIFAVHSLKKESMKVYGPLAAGNLPEARKFLSYIVGRDTQALDPAGITKATVETIAENTTDGVVAPLFYMALGGAPLAFLYKAINTMDSMVGYRNEKYEKFGKAAARLDDAANFIPARLTALIMILASAVAGMDYKNAVRIYRRDRKNHKSPNSAQTESVCAGALDVQLAGDAYYFGQLVHKPTIGDNLRKIVPEDILRANELMGVTAVLAVIFSLIARGLFQ